VFGFHSVFEGPSVRIATGSLLALPGRVASMHELAHQSLTANTTFGQLMQLCAVVEKDEPRRGADLYRLARQCRAVHEGLATFDSVWMAADGDLSVIAGSREYLSWYKDAAQAVPYSDHSRLKLLAVQQVASACMCGPVLENLVRLGPDDPAAWHVEPTDRPDRRLALFHGDGLTGFWRETLQACRELLGEEAWRFFAPEAPSAAALTHTFGEEFEPLVTRLVAYLDGRFEEFLNQRGCRTREPSLESFVQAVQAAESAAPASRGRMNLTDDLTLTEERLDHFFAERILLSDEPRPAQLLTLANELASPFVHRAGNDVAPYVYVIVRSASRLLDQFTFTAQALERLVGLGNTVLTLVVVPASRGGVRLLEVQGPDEVTALVAQLNGRAQIYLTWSMASMGEVTRARAGDRELPLATAAKAMEVSDLRLALLDFSIVAALRAWARRRVPIRYASGIVRLDGSDRLHLFAMRLSSREDLVIVLCGVHQEKVLRQFLEDVYLDAVFDSEILTGDANNALLQAVPRLLESEHVVDYRALLTTRRIA